MDTEFTGLVWLLILIISYAGMCYNPWTVLILLFFLSFHRQASRNRNGNLRRMSNQHVDNQDAMTQTVPGNFENKLLKSYEIPKAQLIIMQDLPHDR